MAQLFLGLVRQRLMDLLEAASAKRLIYINAPAGYGKTFSVRMWLERRRENSNAWLAINESSGKSTEDFYKRLIVALATLQPDNLELKQMLAHESFASAPFEFLEKSLISFRLNLKQDDEHVLIIDDFHLVTNHEILKRLPAIVDDLQELVTLCILSRTEPNANFSKFMVKGLMSLITTEHLIFTADEIKALFASREQRVNERQSRDILATTGGWAIALNALLLSRKALKPNNNLLCKYLETFLKEQIWDKWSSKRRDFLISVSVFDELTPEFCNAMTGRSDSSEILDELVRENAFISVNGDGIYCFHHLFLEFLSSMFKSESPRLRNKIYRKAGDWFYKCGDYYKAVEYYLKGENKSGVTKGLSLMYNYNSPYAAIEKTLSIVYASVNDSIIDEYPFLLEVKAWVSFVEGRSSDMEEYLDKYFKQLPKIIIQHPPSAQTAALLRCMDHRNKVKDIIAGLSMLPLNWVGKLNTPSFTNNMPLFHRSGRDLSDYANSEEKDFELLKKTLGVLLGDEYEVYEGLIRAGLAYECGNHDTAYNLALAAKLKLKSTYAPELQFCSYMLLVSILYAQEQISDAQNILTGASQMLESSRAYYLNTNFIAFTCRLKLNEGDGEAAQNWLNRYAQTPHGDLSLYKLYQHFTTARAYITGGDFSTAILFLKKLLELCTQYRRTLDIIEAKVLLSIAYWKRSKGNQGNAFESLESAIILAAEYGFTQVFTNEGAELINMLHKLQKRVIQKSYCGEINIIWLKNLYYMALMKSKKSKGLTGGKTGVNLTFTDRQKAIMLMLTEGLTHKEMAENLNLKHSTIKSHMNLIFKKLDVSSGIDAIMKIREHNILD
ncbi:MAG: LuxR C-terminal-related transcriptional regulator [Oscillospiraceae bacterium]|nr:LuxR C-terminal-related transcriptional regulator [Oscillospiraceae bacterium]